MRSPWGSGTMLWCALCAATGCGGGGATVTGDVGGYSFVLNTIFAWIDATDADSDQSTGKIIYKAKPVKSLFLVFSGAFFDPEEDQRFVSVEQRLELDHQTQLNGQISAQIGDSDKLTTGMELVQPSMGNPMGPSFNASHRFGLVQLQGDAVFPAEAMQFGGRTTYKLTLDQLAQEPGKSVSGKLVISVEREDNEPAGVITGSVTVEFDAPIIHERIAECNQSEGQSSSCELARPR